MSDAKNYAKILTGKSQLGPYPLEKLKRVEKPTTKITDHVQRVDQRENGFARAARGDFGPFLAGEAPTFIHKYPVSGALKDTAFQLSLKAEGPVAPEKAPLPGNLEILSRHIKRLGYFYRADMMGICELPQYAVYSCDKDGKPLHLPHKYAIAIIIDQDYETMEASTGFDWISGSQSYRSYSTSAFVATTIASYIRKLGYQAYPHHVYTYQIALPPILLLAGLGEMSRMGNCIINPFLGARFKASVVTTDLPLMPDKPIDFGLQEFCRVCKKCAEYCNSKAIPFGDKEMYNGYECWKLDVERCTKFRVGNQQGSSCGTCIKVCPWNKPQGLIHDTVRWAVKNTSFLDGLIVKMDDALGYGKPNPDKKWWFDMELVGEVMKLPSEKSKGEVAESKSSKSRPAPW